MIHSSRNPEVSGKPNAVFPCHSESSQKTFSERDRSNEPGNRFESSVHSVFFFANPANVGKSLLDGNKDHLLNQARNIMWDLLTIVSMSSSSKLMLSDWNCRTPLTDMWNLEDSKFDCKKNFLCKKKHFEILRSEVRTRWERGRELKNYESTNSLYKH